MYHYFVFADSLFRLGLKAAYMLSLCFSMHIFLSTLLLDSCHYIHSVTFYKVIVFFYQILIQKQLWILNILPKKYTESMYIYFKLIIIKVLCKSIWLCYHMRIKSWFCVLWKGFFFLFLYNLGIIYIFHISQYVAIELYEELHIQWTKRINYFSARQLYVTFINLYINMYRWNKLELIWFRLICNLYSYENEGMF